MKKEFYVPLMYTCVREQYRSGLSLRTSVVRAVSNQLKQYIWVPVFCMIMLNEYLNPAMYLALAGHLILFLIAYETGYLYVDNISVKYENKEIRNVLFDPPVPERTVYISIFIRLCLVAAALYMMNDVTMSFFYVLTIATFFLHGMFKEQFRVITFVMLRTLKGIVPYLFMIIHLPKQYIILLCTALLTNSVFYALEYAGRKLVKISVLKAYDDKNTWVKILLMFVILSIIAYFEHISFASVVLMMFVIMFSSIFMIIVSWVKNRTIK